MSALNTIGFQRLAKQLTAQEFNRLNRLTKKLDSRNGQLIFTYDKVGNLLTKTTYQNTTTHYQYNAANRLVSLSNLDYLQADYQLDPAGRVLSRVSNSGARSLMQYDANGWLSKLSQYDSANALVSEATYTRDRVGNILTQTNTAGANPGTITYTYDALYRLTTADYPNASNDEAYTYDKVGNRKTATKGSLSANATTRYYNYTANTNRLAEIRIGSASGALDSAFSYDFEGNLTNQTGSNPKTFVWDAKGRLKTLTKSGVTETYGYDPMDYRIRHSNTANGQLDYFLEGEHLESVEQGGETLEKYFRGASTDELIAAYLKGTDGKTKPYQYHHDQLTSTTQVTAHNGGTLQSTTYSAFGATQSQTGSSPNRLKYTGREDDGTGLYYYRARYYDPSTGRFISEDPLGFEAGINFYAYVDNNPINANDPTGMDPMHIGAAIVGGVGGVITQGGIDLARGKLGSFADYAGAFTGGAAGGAAAVTCGPACAGATAGAVSSATTQGINRLYGQAASGLSFLTDTAVGAMGGKIASSVVPYVFKTALPNLVGTGTANQIKGQIGESISAIGLIASGKSFSTQVENGIVRNGQSSTFDFGLPGYRNFVETKWGMATLSSAQRDASQLPGTSLTLHQWGYPIVSGIVGGSFAAGSAGGGYLLYPNKSNNNLMQSVYSK